MPPSPTRADLAGDWVVHLRAGGTVPWCTWRDERPAPPAERPPVLPGAQQLELLRRLNLQAPVPPELAARVLAASAPGRGQPDLQLEGVVEQVAFGPPPVDPGLLPDDELIRVAASLIADDVATTGLPDRPRPRRTRWRRRRYRVAGDRALTDPVRAALIAQGRPPGGRGSTILVLGTDLATMVVDAWTVRSLAEGAPRWPDWLAAYARRRALPPAADLLRAARTWAGRAGREQVRVVLDPAALPGLVGVRRPLPGRRVLGADETELARRVGQVLDLLAVPGRKRALVQQTLLPRLVGHGGPPLVVPERYADWLHAAAVRMRDGLLRGGYAVVGDPDRLLPVVGSGVVEPSDAGVLELALRLLLETPDPGSDERKAE